MYEHALQRRIETSRRASIFIPLIGPLLKRNQKVGGGYHSMGLQKRKPSMNSTPAFIAAQDSAAYGPTPNVKKCRVPCSDSPLVIKL